MVFKGKGRVVLGGVGGLREDIDPLVFGSLRLRRRTVNYCIVVVVLLILGWRWSAPELYLYATGMSGLALAAWHKRAGPDTTRWVILDLSVVTVLVAVLGLSPTAVGLVWAGTLAMAHFTLPKPVVAVASLFSVVMAAGLLMVGDRLALGDPSPDQLLMAEGVALVIGLGFVLTVYPDVSGKLSRAIDTAELHSAELESLVRWQRSTTAMVSHELRTPITAIRGFAEILVSDDFEVSDDERLDYLKTIHSQAVDLGRIIDDILTAMRLDERGIAVENEPLLVAEVVRSVLEGTASRPGHIVSVEVDPALTVHADPHRTRQIVRNLLVNAYKYGGPSIVVRGREGRPVRIEVEDDGIGISPEAADRVFEQYARESGGHEGYGLGLPISRRLAQMMAGDLVYEPIEGGARFVLTLPPG